MIRLAGALLLISLVPVGVMAGGHFVIWYYGQQGAAPSAGPVPPSETSSRALEVRSSTPKPTLGQRLGRPGSIFSVAGWIVVFVCQLGVVFAIFFGKPRRWTGVLQLFAVLLLAALCFVGARESLPLYCLGLSACATLVLWVSRRRQRASECAES